MDALELLDQYFKCRSLGDFMEEKYQIYSSQSHDPEGRRAPTVLAKQIKRLADAKDWKQLLVLSEKYSDEIGNIPDRLRNAAIKRIETANQTVTR